MLSVNYLPPIHSCTSSDAASTLPTGSSCSSRSPSLRTRSPRSLCNSRRQPPQDVRDPRSSLRPGAGPLSNMRLVSAPHHLIGCRLRCWTYISAPRTRVDANRTCRSRLTVPSGCQESRHTSSLWEFARLNRCGVIPYIVVFNTFSHPTSAKSQRAASRCQLTHPRASPRSIHRRSALCSRTRPRIALPGLHPAQERGLPPYPLRSRAQIL